MEIIMTLKSDTIPGSGTSLAGIIDRDIAYNELGLPYIPAKRLKGVLRESAEELRLENIDNIFGLEGSAKGSSFRLDNGFIDKHQEFTELLQSKKMDKFLHPQSVLDYFTYTRSQTTIENGVAKENSLRISRVLKKGLKFVFPLECNSVHIGKLRNVCKVTRSMGASRSRGFGEIELKLVENETTKDVAPQKKPTPDIDSQKDSTTPASLPIKVSNIEQLLVSAKPGSSQISESYIPGTVLLGALAAHYLKSHKDTEAQFIELFLSGKLSFGNLYPFDKKANSEEHYYPAPLSVKKVKEKIPQCYDYYDHLLLDDLDDEDQEILNEVVFKGSLTGYVTSDLRYATDTIKDVEAHHWRPKDRHIAKATKESGDFFQFEVIAMNQDFSGKIIGPENLLSELLPYFPDDGIIRLGKSKTGQYGKCSFKLGMIEEIASSQKWEAEDELKIIFTSDMILLNDCGFAIPNINLFVKEFAARLDVEDGEIELVRQFSSTTNSGGFMGVWRMPRPQNPALSAGTVIELKNNSGKDLDLTNIKAFLFGNRVEDGFGRIAVHNYSSENGGLNEPGKQDERPASPAVSSEDSSQEIKELLEFRVRQILKRKLLAQAIQKADKPILINSFIGKIMAFLNSSQSYEDFSEKIDKIKAEKQKSNLRKIATSIFININDQNIDVDEFKNFIDHSLPDPFNNAQVKKITSSLSDVYKKARPPFDLYKYYALSYLVQQKLRNRG